MQPSKMTTIVSIASALLFIAGSMPVRADDCNSNGFDDAQDIAAGTSQDCNTNGVPDECDLGSYHFIRAWGTLGSGTGEFDDPGGVAVDTAGFVYVVDRGNLRVQKFEGDGTYICEWPTTGGAPKHIAVDESDGCYAYVAYFYDQGSGPGYLIEKFTCEGTWEDNYSCGEYGSGGGQFDHLEGLAVDGSGHLYVGDWDNDRFQKLANLADGCTYMCDGGSSGSGPGEFHAPSGVALACGQVYVGDSVNERIQVWTSDCSFVNAWSTPGRPWGVAADSAGNVYVSVHTNDKVLKYTCSGLLLTQWGVPGNGPGEFDSPTGVAVDSAGSVYVVDDDNNRIQKFRAWSDCDEDGILDECEGNDCNSNDVPDECDPDFDGDGSIDDCDDDIDNDGVPNEPDVCDYTPWPAVQGARVIMDSQSCLYGTIRGDHDGDCDCDLWDYAEFQLDFTGPNG